MSIRMLALITAVALFVVYLTTGHSTVVATGSPPEDTAAAQDTTSPDTIAPATSAVTPTTTPAAGAAQTPPTNAPVIEQPASSPATAAIATATTKKPAAPAKTPAKTPAKAPATTAAPAPVPMAAAPPAPLVVAPTVLELGVVHPWVVLSQRRLNTLGYGPIEADGRFGPATKSAVVRFEQSNQATVDGRLEAGERLLLLSNNAQSYVAPAPPMPVGVPAAPAQPPAKLPVAGGPLATAATARTNANCQGIEAEFLRQGAEADVADQFAYVIAPRESGCWPQMVSSATDLSYSRLGLNFIGAMPKYWGNLCGVTDYLLTAELSVDVRCGLAAYRALGWKPWSL